MSPKALFLSLVVVPVAPALAQPAVAPGVYEYVAAPGISWADARLAAESMTLPGCAQAHLATIASLEENSLVAGAVDLDGVGEAWIGAYQPDPFSAPDEGWEWVTAEPFVYSNWRAPGEPNDAYGPGSESHAAILGRATGVLGSWNDEGRPQFVSGYVIEYECSLECRGFEPPMASVPVTVRGNRALPLKAQLFDAEDRLITDYDLTAPPIVQVWFAYGTPAAQDVSDEALPAGQSTEGNQFFFDSDQRWHYNLKTTAYSAPGTYTVFLESGDDAEYLVDPTCAAQFVVK